MPTYFYAIGSQIVFYVYWLATEWIDFFPWNDIRSAKRKDQIAGTILHTILMALCMIAFFVGNKWLMVSACIWFTILLSVEICNWVLPYLFGIHLTEIDKETYGEHFVRTYRFLPPIKDHNIIDAQHTVVILLTMVMWGISFGSLIEAFSS